VVGNVHAAEVTTGISAVYDMAVWKDVSEGAFLAKLAVALGESAVSPSSKGAGGCLLTFVKYLQGARSVSGSSEWRNGQAFPAWQAPCR